MGRKGVSEDEIRRLVHFYEDALANNRPIYLDGDQFADIASQYALDGRYTEAQHVIDAGLVQHPGNTDLLLEQAYLYIDFQDWSKAEETANAIVGDFDEDVRFLKAEIALKKGNISVARSLLDNMGEVDLDLLIDIAYLYLDMGYPQETLRWIKRGKVLYGEKESFLLLQADYEVEVQQYESAVNDYNKLLDIDAYNPSYWTELSKCHSMLDNIEKAIESCDFALAADERFGEAYVQRAHCYFYLGNLEKAIADYKNAVRYKSLAPEVGHWLIGLAYKDKDDWKTSEMYFRDVIRLCREKEGGAADDSLLLDAYNNLAQVVYNQGRPEEAHQICNVGLTIDSSNALILLTKGNFYLKEGNYKEACRAFDIALRFCKGEKTELWYLIGSYYEEEELLHQAKCCYEKAYEINPQYSDLTNKLAILSLAEGDAEKFFQYNQESPNPISESIVYDLLSRFEGKDSESEQFIKSIWEQMRKMKE